MAKVNKTGQSRIWDECVLIQTGNAAIAPREDVTDVLPIVLKFLESHPDRFLTMW
jgi:hypothetical protein